jgi:Flp pilus assembly pilin Flp
MNLVKRLIREEEGQDIIEYVLIAAAISVIAIPIVPAVGTAVLNAWTNVSGQVTAIPGAGGGS